MTINIIKNNYDGGACPDCSEDIPDDVETGDACSNCGHVFYHLQVVEMGYTSSYTRIHLNLIEELKIAVDIIDNHHVNCDWMAEPDLNAEITETCAEFDEIYGKDFTRFVCHDHDKLREWSKMLKEYEGAIR